MNSKLHTEIQGLVNEHGQSDLEKNRLVALTILRFKIYRATVINTT